MDALLAQMILDRLGEDDVGDGAADLVLAGCQGDAVLADALGGGYTARPREDGQLELVAQPHGAYLASIGVEGFRGIGPRAELALAPGPGLVLVVGRNGSGKSSFAEALELLMTGANSRWQNRTKVWSEGWQNLHAGGDTVLAATLHVDGRPEPVALERRWARGAPLTAGAEPPELDELGWTAALARYRPFLSYHELGQMFDELKTMYDALSAILGLEDLEDLQRCLRDARLGRDRAARDLRARVKALIGRVAALGDDRAREVLAALEATPVDLDAIELVVEGAGDEADPGHALTTLRHLAAVGGPEPDEVEAALGGVEAARAALGRLAHTDAARAASLAELLERALGHDAEHGEETGDCPVCATPGVIDAAWRLRTAREVARLAREASAVDQAATEVRRAERALVEIVPRVPQALLDHARELDLDPGSLEVALERWDEVRLMVGDPEAVPRIRGELHEVTAVARRFAEAAQAELDRREDAWRPVALELAGWLPEARAALAAAGRLPDLEAAEQWVKETAEALRAERLAPIADAAKANWDALRQDSNVSLEGFALRKSGNVRRAQVDVRVDGADATAFGVMSQGELHALAVSVFLPRAGLDESPFRFMVIDDPVQSMDPAKVDGLARVLAGAARRRQVVVFSHDERLPAATRRLGIPATVLEVTRRPGSVVEVRTALDPVERALDDARAPVRSARGGGLR